MLSTRVAALCSIWVSAVLSLETFEEQHITNPKFWFEKRSLSDLSRFIDLKPIGRVSASIADIPSDLDADSPFYLGKRRDADFSSFIDLKPIGSLTASIRRKPPGYQPGDLVRLMDKRDSPNFSGFIQLKQLGTISSSQGEDTNRGRIELGSRSMDFGKSRKAIQPLSKLQDLLSLKSAYPFVASSYMKDSDLESLFKRQQPSK